MSENGIGKVACVRVKPRYAPITTWTALYVLDENAQAGGGMLTLHLDTEEE